jgi:hypothetical protein
MEYDPGPPPAVADIFSQLPSYEPFKQHYWFDWGPIFYRGRLDGSARVLCIASDPGPTERIAHRTLVGDAGQRVQGLLTKVGLTRSYLCLNAHAYALFPSAGAAGLTVLADPGLTQWRNNLFGHVKGPNLQAVIAFGQQAQKAVDLWPGIGAVHRFDVPHPSSHDPKALLDAWRVLVTQLRAAVTPDADGTTTGPNYGATFAEADYARIPARDLPFGVPNWLGDDSWGRQAHPAHGDAVSRPGASGKVTSLADSRHTLIWIAPGS